jgi:hypothetical protein
MLDDLVVSRMDHRILPPFYELMASNGFAEPTDNDVEILLWITCEQNGAVMDHNEPPMWSKTQSELVCFVPSDPTL